MNSGGSSDQGKSFERLTYFLVILDNKKALLKGDVYWMQKVTEKWQMLQALIAVKKWSIFGIYRKIWMHEIWVEKTPLKMPIELYLYYELEGSNQMYW